MVEINNEENSKQQKRNVKCMLNLKIQIIVILIIMSVQNNLTKI